MLNIPEYYDIPAIKLLADYSKKYRFKGSPKAIRKKLGNSRFESLGYLIFLGNAGHSKKVIEEIYGFTTPENSEFLKAAANLYLAKAQYEEDPTNGNYREVLEWEQKKFIAYCDNHMSRQDMPLYLFMCTEAGIVTEPLKDLLSKVFKIPRNYEHIREVDYFPLAIQATTLLFDKFGDDYKHGLLKDMIQNYRVGTAVVYAMFAEQVAKVEKYDESLLDTLIDPKYDLFDRFLTIHAAFRLLSLDSGSRGIITDRLRSLSDNETFSAVMTKIKEIEEQLEIKSILAEIDEIASQRANL